MGIDAAGFSTTHLRLVGLVYLFVYLPHSRRLSTGGQRHTWSNNKKMCIHNAYVYMHIYIYIYIYVCMYMHMHTSLSLSLSVRRHTHTPIYIHIYTKRTANWQKVVRSCWDHWQKPVRRLSEDRQRTVRRDAHKHMHTYITHKCVPIYGRIPK